MMDISIESEPHVSLQTTGNPLATIGSVVALILLLATLTGVGTFLRRVDGLTGALVDMRQQCLEARK